MTLERLYLVNLFKILSKLMHENTFRHLNVDESPFSFDNIIFKLFVKLLIFLILSYFFLLFKLHFLIIFRLFLSYFFNL